ncbi:CAU/MBL1b family subclass B3 metallo-beta-lactamase [Mesorhizobium sp. L-8-3]|nr:CAU/MBL1b family subclass B3 metallo-beta-lactamase [Mesorhizobium sp. L-8-3]
MLFAGAISLTLLVGIRLASLAAAEEFPAEWTEPTRPFRIVGDIYYVGTKGLAAYLIRSGGEAVLIDGTMPENAALVEANVEALGMPLGDVDILLLSHAHIDHAGALAELKRHSGAALYASEGDRWALENGKHDGDSAYSFLTFPPVTVDHALKDGEVVTVGSLELTATLTPGHTKGCTTWSVPVIENGETLRVVFPCSLSVAGNVLAGNMTYPTIAADYRRSFGTVGAMEADVVLPSHPGLGGVLQRAARRDAGDPRAFVDRALLKRIVDDARAAFEKELSKAKR